MISNYRNNAWFFAGVLLICFLVSSGFRYRQFETWQKTPSAYFVGERPMMTTLDAPIWLRYAREFNEGKNESIDSLRNYPEGSDTFLEISRNKYSIPTKFLDPIYSGTKEIKYYDVPLLSFLIARLSPYFDYNYYLTGTLLIPVLASLFILPLGVFFFRIDLPVSGLLGGLIGTFSGAYYMRSSIGRIDTDMLNLFFPLLAGLMILLASRAKYERSVMIHSIGAGLTLFMFQWWYAKPGFTLVYFAVLVFSLFIHKIRLGVILLSALFFILCARPGTFMSGTGNVQYFIKGYFSIEETNEVVFKNVTTPASFPNTMSTISEVDGLSIEEVFKRVLSNRLFCWAGFLAFIIMMVLHWRMLLPLAPMIVLGLFSFKSSNRFIMYLAPFIGIGLGWMLSIVIEGLFNYLGKKQPENT